MIATTNGGVSHRLFMEGSMSEIILQAKNLSKTFSVGGNQQHVLNNLNIEIKKGEFVVIMGNSGSGKSTLLYALSGMDKPSLGELYYGDERIDEYNNDELAKFRRKNCGFVFQDVFLNENMSIMDNVLVTGYLASKNKKEVIEKAKKLLANVGIDDSMLNKFPTQMSGGELQRVGMVRAMINEPKVIFADEPTGALNSVSAINVLNLLNNINDDGMTVVMVTHDIKSAIRGERILYLKDGIILNSLYLDKYKENSAAERLEKTSEFLNDMGW